MTICPVCGAEFDAWRQMAGHKGRKHPGAEPASAHGTNARYQAGCCCPECLAGHSGYMKEWRQRHPGYATAWMRGYRERLRRQRRRGSTWEVVADYLDTYGAATVPVLVARIHDRHPDISVYSVRQSLHRLSLKGLAMYDGEQWSLTVDDWLEAVS